MDKENSKKIKKEFFRITRIFPRHRTNYVHDRRVRQDGVFPQLADRAFDYPKLLDILVKKTKEWLRKDKSELTSCLTGYIYYLKQDFKHAEACFLKAIEKNPHNLDNWLDLGFSLYHQNRTKHELAKSIFFNFNFFIQKYTSSSYKKCNLPIIKELSYKTTRWLRRSQILSAEY